MRLFICSISLIAFALMLKQDGSADVIIYSEACGGKDAIEYGYSRMLEPCESGMLSIEREKHVGSLCTAEFEACRDDRMSKLGVSSEEAEDFCMYRPTSLDPNFKGACPAHLEELESPKYDADKWLLDRTHTRLGFTQFTEEGERIFRQRDSARRLRKLLESEPNNLAALNTLSVLFDENGIVETIKLEIKRYELERDCPKHWDLIPRWLNGHFGELAENWLDGKGTGSELNEDEIHDLIQQTRGMLIDMYDDRQERWNNEIALCVGFDQRTTPYRQTQSSQEDRG